MVVATAYCGSEGTVNLSELRMNGARCIELLEDNL